MDPMGSIPHLQSEVQSPPTRPGVGADQQALKDHPSVDKMDEMGEKMMDFIIFCWKKILSQFLLFFVVILFLGRLTMCSETISPVPCRMIEQCRSTHIKIKTWMFPSAIIRSVNDFGNNMVSLCTPSQHKT